MIDFAKLKSMSIPEGNVERISAGGLLLWEKVKKKYKAELEYLESTGTQWFDTGIQAPMTVEATLQGVSAKSRTSIVLSIGGASGAGDYLGFRTFWLVGINTGEMFNIEHSEKITATIVWTEDGIAVTIDGSTVTRSGGVSGNLRVGSPSSTYGASCKIFSVKISNDSGEVVRDFVPVLDWDDRPCMYDRVTDELYYNQGTGEFAYG